MSGNGVFRALVSKAKKVPAQVELFNCTQLPLQSTVKASPGECQLHIKVSYSNLNYKDALVVTGAYPGLKTPMIGGIDLVGQVMTSTGQHFKEGDTVLVNGFGMGTDHFGGFAEEARVRAEWAIGLPKGLTEVDVAKIGTAGYTAMLCIDALERNGVTKDKGPVLVTGKCTHIKNLPCVKFFQRF